MHHSTNSHMHLLYFCFDLISAKLLPYICISKQLGTYGLLQVLSRLLHWHSDAFSTAGALAYVDPADKVKGGTPLHIAAAEGATL